MVDGVEGGVAIGMLIVMSMCVMFFYAPLLVAFVNWAVR